MFILTYIGAEGQVLRWKCNFPPLQEIMTDQRDGPTDDRRTEGSYTL